MKWVKINKEEKYIKDFLSLPIKLYERDENMEDIDEVKSLLLERHPLSPYFKLHPFILYKDKEPVGRFAITTYKDDSICYLGFFESINNKEIGKEIFDKAKEFAKENNYNKIIGPYNSSFWINYRLKINKFNIKPYTGEPYNKDYYYSLFLENRFKVIEHYTSNIYDVVAPEYTNRKFLNRYNAMKEKGCTIRSPKRREFNKVIKELYYLLSNLYKDFPGYKEIEYKDFYEIFKNYKYILDFNLVKMAYKDEKPIGFFISVPNYNNKVYHLNSIRNILSVLKTRLSPKEYILMYIGAMAEYKGLGSALSYKITEELKKNKATSIGALAKDGKVTQNYADDLIESQYEYVLLEWDVND